MEHPWADEVRAVHRHYPTGVTVVTTCVDGEPYGLAVNAFSSISLTPPLVLVCVAVNSNTHERLFNQEHFAVNILAHDQADIAARFAKSGGDKFADLEWRRGDRGSPILEGVSAHLELSIETRMPAYTHTVFVGRVEDACAGEKPPLLYLAGQFFDGSAVSPASA
jgi:flavin reductase (DIM6/NTAB) family NADH-FMN oxidoreductase RutF